MAFINFTFTIFFVTIVKNSHAVPPAYCLANLNTSNCGRAPTPVVHYYKPTSLCEIALWRGCPTLNKFDNVYDCSNLCVGKLWAKEKKRKYGPRDDKCNDKKKGDIGDDKCNDKKKGDIGDYKFNDKKKGDIVPGREIQIETIDDSRAFQFFSISHESLSFEVKATKDVRIIFTTEPKKVKPIVTVVIGGGRGIHWSVMTTHNTKGDGWVVKDVAETPNILDGGEFRGFWIRWDSGNYSVGKRDEAKPFLSWKNPCPFKVKYVGFSTGFGSTGSWKIKGVD